MAQNPAFSVAVAHNFTTPVEENINLSGETPSAPRIPGAI